MEPGASLYKERILATVGENVKDKKYLVVSADDFGISEKVNRGIIHAFNEGIVTSTAVMANMPGFKDAMKLIQANEALDIGLHVTLTCGKPVSPTGWVRTLINESGGFFPLGEFAMRCLTRGISYDEVYLEMESQLKKALAHGVTITHIDCHHHLQAFLVVHSAMCDLAVKYKVRFMRVPISRRYLPDYMFTTGNLKRFAIMTLAAHCLMRKQMSGVSCPENILGITEGCRDISANVLPGIISLCGAGLNELVCHPGYADVDLKRYDSYYDRIAEVDALTSNAVRQALAENNIILTNFANAVAQLL